MLTATDFFCGAGGSSTGMEDAGVEVRHAANHWDLAIETHNTNHPNTKHYLDDLQQAHPSWYPRTDIAWFSPECTNHSLAKGRRRKGAGQLSLWDKPTIDPDEERSRATMREVIEFTEFHRYEIVIVENVVDIRYWRFYNDWFMAMENLGYHSKTLYLNAQFFGVPQSRDRWYTVFWKKGNPAPDLNFRPSAYCACCDEVIAAVQSWKKSDFPWGRYGRNRQYIYRCPQCTGEVVPATTPASVAIDWSIPAQRIGDRERPLKPKTIERIKAGLRKFASKPILVDLAYTHADHRHKITSADSPLPTQTTCQTLGMTLPPFLMSYYSRNNAQSGIDQPMPTIPTENRHSLIIPPFLTALRGWMATASRGVNEPLTTIVAAGSQHALITPPFIMTHFSNPVYKTVAQPLSTIVGSTAHHMLIMAYYGSNSVFALVNQPLPGITTIQRHALIDAEDIVEDCRFRMLEPEELKIGMSFPEEYVILGSKRNQVKQIGNAVCCHVAAWITHRCVLSLS